MVFKSEVVNIFYVIQETPQGTSTYNFSGYLVNCNSSITSQHLTLVQHLLVPQGKRLYIATQIQLLNKLFK